MVQGTIFIPNLIKLINIEILWRSMHQGLILILLVKAAVKSGGTVSENEFIFILDCSKRREICSCLNIFLIYWWLFFSLFGLFVLYVKRVNYCQIFTIIRPVWNYCIGAMAYGLVGKVLWFWHHFWLFFEWRVLLFIIAYFFWIIIILNKTHHSGYILLF